MSSFCNPLAAATTAGLTAVAVWAAPAYGQGYFQVATAQGMNAPMQQINRQVSRNTQAAFRWGGGFGGWGWPGYYGPIQSPAGSYLSGAADVISAQGQFIQDFYQGKLTREQVRSARMDNRRRSVDEWLYERAVLPTPEEERERTRQEFLRRSLNNPPETEIWAGQALNNLLADVQRMRASRVEGPTVLLTPDITRRINVTSGATPGSVGVLRNGGKLTWPLWLRSATFQANRDKMDTIAAKAYQEAKSPSGVDADTLNAMGETLDKLRSDLSATIRDTPSSQFIAARRFLNELNDTFRTLQDPASAQYFDRSWLDEGSTVGELVDNMTKRGMRFAPATGTDRAAYTALHSALVEFHNGMAQLVAMKSKDAGAREKPAP
jgi:hypothetical protein